jgi:hypothetical protein
LIDSILLIQDHFSYYSNLHFFIFEHRSKNSKFLTERKGESLLNYRNNRGNGEEGGKEEGEERFWGVHVFFVDDVQQHSITAAARTNKDWNGTAFEPEEGRGETPPGRGQIKFIILAPSKKDL